MDDDSSSEGQTKQWGGMLEEALPSVPFTELWVCGKVLGVTAWQVLNE